MSVLNFSHNRGSDVYIHLDKPDKGPAVLRAVKEQSDLFSNKYANDCLLCVSG